MPREAIREFCFLQLRMLCELIALACLAAHGDLEKIGKLKKAGEPHKIIGYLEKLHPEFYPRAATQTKGGPEEFDAVLRTDGFLTKQEFIKLHGKCGDVLHRGSMRVVIARKHASTDVNDIVAWKGKIEILLAYHLIFMLDNKTVVFFVLRNKANNDQVQVAVCSIESAMSILS